MDDQRVVLNLQEIDEQQASRFLTELLSNLSPQEEYTPTASVIMVEPVCRRREVSRDYGFCSLH